MTNGSSLNEVGHFLIKPWFNWNEPERRLLVEWQQYSTYEDLEPVHRQVNDGETTVYQQRAQFIDARPLAVVEQRRSSLYDAVVAVKWGQGRPVRLDTSAAVVA